MRDDEMKKRGITENNGDWGSLRLLGLGFNHPATPSFTFPPRRLFNPQLPSLLFFLSVGVVACRHISDWICRSPKYSKMIIYNVFFGFFFPSWGFFGSLLSVKTPYVGFNSGHILCAACVVPAGVSSSALSPGDDSVACFAVACFAFCTCSNTGCFICLACLASALLLPLVFVHIQSGHVCDSHGFNTKQPG